jgi:glutathione S-transferase
MESTYIIYGGELSYFTRKLEAAFTFYNLKFERRSKHHSDPGEIEARSGTHQVPVLQTPENWMIGDTTPIMHLVDGRAPHRKMFPDGPEGILVQIIEEYFDEWIARTMVHYRWNYAESAEFAAIKLANGDEKIAAQMQAWGPKVCRATGVDSDIQKQAAEDEYERILTAVESQLKQTRYLLGDRPTAVDCVVLGGLRAHTHLDPVPRRVTEKYERVVAFSEGELDQWDGDGALPTFPETTEFGGFILQELKTTYQPYALANGEAQAAGAKAFHAPIYGEEVSYLSRPYPETSRKMITTRIRDELASSERDQINDWLGREGLTVFLV